MNFSSLFAADHRDKARFPTGDISAAALSAMMVQCSRGKAEP
jgi:hypothetical protein